MDKEDISIVIIVLSIMTIIVVCIICGEKREANVNKYCFEKYQNLEEIKICKEIFYK